MSSPIRPAWMSCTAAIEVNSLVIEAMSKMVLLRIGIHWSRGSSVGLASE